MDYSRKQSLVADWLPSLQRIVDADIEAVALFLCHEQHLQIELQLPPQAGSHLLAAIHLDEQIKALLLTPVLLDCERDVQLRPWFDNFACSHLWCHPLFDPRGELFSVLVMPCHQQQLTTLKPLVDELSTQFSFELHHHLIQLVPGSQLQQAFKLLPDAYYLLSLSGKIKDFHAGNDEPLNLELGLCVEQRFEYFLRAENAKLFVAALSNIQAGLTEVCFVLGFEEPQPERFYEARLLRTEQDSVVLILHENSEQHRHRVQLLAQEKHYHSLFDSSGIGLAVVDSRAQFKQVNYIFAKLLGLPVEQLVGKSIWPHVHEGNRSQLQYWHKLRSSGYKGKLPRRLECIYYDGEGKSRWVAVGVSPATDLDCYIVSALDITRSKRAEQDLNLAAKVFNHTVEGVVICDPKNIIIQVNDAFCTITGFSRAEVLGKTPQILSSGYHEPDFYSEMWATIKADGQWRGEIHNRRKDGGIYPELLTISTVYDKDGRISNYVGAFSDITQLKRSEERLRYLASHDVLTDLPNRLMLIESLGSAIVQAQRNQSMLAVAFIDIDHFKKINDSLGHATGDALLKDVSQRLLSSLRQSDQLARIGGDEFVILLQNIKNADDVMSVMGKLLEQLEDPLMINEHRVRVTLSAGVSLYPQDGDDVDSLLKNADAAMYSAKDRGRNNFQFYTKELTSQAYEHLLLESALQQALQQQEFRLCYQPLVNLKDSSVVGFEALLRWYHPELGEVSPGRFIPVAEKTGLVVPIGEWVIKQACLQAQQWLDQGMRLGTLAVNVSGAQLQGNDFVDVVKQALADSHFPAECLELELTESVVMQHSEHSSALLNDLKSLGLKLSIDDFGTGYSSLSYLSSLPIDKLKIDRSFVSKMLDDKQNCAIADAVIGLGKALDLPVLAEGIEQSEQAKLLQQRDCLYAQGYFYSPPLEAENVASFMRDYQAPI